MSRAKYIRYSYCIFGVISVVSLVILIWYWSTESTKIEAGQMQQIKDAAISTSIATDKHNSAVRSGSGNSQDLGKGRPPELFSAHDFIESAANKSIALASLYIIYGDPIYLEYLKQRVKIDPEAAVLLAVALSNGTQREAFIGYLRDAHEQFPDNAYILICLSGMEASFKNFDVARELLHGISLLDDQHFIFPNLEPAMRDLMLKNGVDSDAAWIEAAGKERMIESGIGYFSTGIIKLMAEVMAKGTPEAKLEFTSDIVALAQRLNPDDSALRMNTGTSTSLEIGALRMLPPDTAYGDEGKTAKQRLEDIYKIQDKEDYILRNIEEVLRKADPTAMRTYDLIWAKEGKPAAIAWAEKWKAQKK